MKVTTSKPKASRQRAVNFMLFAQNSKEKGNKK